jgi:Stress responsive A/B Barrel Domain
MLVHTVFFWLKPDLTPAHLADFRRGVETLGKIKSVDKFYFGLPAATERRPVIDHTFSLGITVICKDVAAEKAYQVDPIHLEFVRSCKDYWTRVQVYDFE